MTMTFYSVAKAHILYVLVEKFLESSHMSCLQTKSYDEIISSGRAWYDEHSSIIMDISWTEIDRFSPPKICFVCWHAKPTHNMHVRISSILAFPICNLIIS
ncbi:hypothetical protein L6164_037175 [Bauhinia variegata]|uniref:Uncharacterized protein n=1 Tax=Bauhinia variegata TaxID=167791 RepID=A0ACB9KJF8_BAUVA|nr:hypothetical protein L6164_037175 [Bauhinia variegata]